MSQADAPARWKAEIALAFVALVWGSTFVVVKGALAEISTIYFLALRFGLATVAMVFMFWRAFQTNSGRAIRTGILGGAVAGVLLWLGYLLQTFGLKYTTAGKSGFITGFYIALVPLLGAIFYRRWPPVRELAGIAVAMAGIVVLTFPRNGSFQMNRGDLLTLGCALVFAIHILVLAYYSQRELVPAVALGQIACCAVLSLVSLSWEPPIAIWSTKVVVALVLTSIFATALAFALQTWGQKHTSPSRTALIFSLEPVFALATAVLIGNEPLTTAALVGGALVLVGILLVEVK
jgi:drug/metabolite transporter (DMT)-like permease